MIVGDFMRFKGTSIKFKLTISFTIVSVILLLSVGLLFFKSNKTAIIDSKQKEFKTLAEETGNKIERFLFERYGDIQVMSDSPILRRGDINNSIKLEYIESVRKAYKTYDYILTTDNKGNVEVVSGNLNGDKNYEKWIQYALNGNIFVSDISYLSSSRSYVIYLLAPLKDSEDKVKGVVVEKVNFESINDIVKNVKLGKSGYAYLASDKGDIMLYPNNYTKLNVNLKNGGDTINYTEHNNTQYVYARYLLNKYGTQTTSWYLVVEQPEKDAFEVSYSLRKYTMLVVGISMLGIVILALITSERITKPFNVMNSNLKSMEQKVIKISDELERSVMRAKSLEALAAMSAGMAHEIRNPLTSVKGYAQYIQLELEKDNKLQEDISIIIDEVDRLNRIVDRFLSFARPKQVDLKPENINEIVRDLIKVTNKEICKNNIKLVVKLNKIPLILMDYDQIKQVVLNMIINSIQAMPNGGILNISTGIIKDLKMIYLEISDNGIGIRPEDYDKIFEPFFTTKDKGAGLGLAICSRIIQNHNGFIEVVSNLNEGTRFIIKLPMVEA